MHVDDVAGNVCQALNEGGGDGGGRAAAAEDSGGLPWASLRYLGAAAPVRRAPWAHGHDCAQAHGEAAQVEPVLKAPVFSALKLEYDKLLLSSVPGMVSNRSFSSNQNVPIPTKQKWCLQSSGAVPGTL